MSINEPLVLPNPGEYVRGRVTEPLNPLPQTNAVANKTNPPSDDPVAAALAQGGVPLQSVPEESQPGLVVVTADESARYSRFALCLQGLQVPQGSNTAWMIGNDIPESRNAAVANMLTDPTYKWVWFIDDDHAFEPFILLKLLSTRKQIVGPLVLRRQQPFYSTATALDDNFLRFDENLPTSDLVEVMATGSSGLLIRREALEAIGTERWFELAYDDDGRRISEDINFCRRARMFDYPIYVHTAIRLGHITTAVVWPARDEDHWVTTFEVADGALLKILVTDPPEQEADSPEQ